MNTIRELKAKEKYDNMLKRKNKVINELLSRIANLEYEVEKLNNIINEAIEYLESYNTDFKHSRFNEAPISIRELGDLLDILKGSDK